MIEFYAHGLLFPNETAASIPNMPLAPCQSRWLKKNAKIAKTPRKQDESARFKSAREQFGQIFCVL